MPLILASLLLSSFGGTPALTRSLSASVLPRRAAAVPSYHPVLSVCSFVRARVSALVTRLSRVDSGSLSEAAPTESVFVSPWSWVLRLGLNLCRVPWSWVAPAVSEFELFVLFW